MVWLTLVSIIVCLSALMAQREHYKHQDLKTEKKEMNRLDSDILATRVEVDELKSKLDKLALKVGFR